MACLSSVKGLRELLHRYDVLLLDQFGVLHDGKNIHPQAWDATKRFRSECSAKKIAVLASNSSRSSSVAMQGLLKMGCDVGLLDGAVTSGEVSQRWMIQRKESRQKNGGKVSECIHEQECNDEGRKIQSSSLELVDGRRLDSFVGSDLEEERNDGVLEDVVHMTWQWRGHQSLCELGLRGVSRAELYKATLMVTQGADAIADGDDLVPMEDEDMKELVLECAQKRMEMLCANPDIYTVYGKELVKMPGFYADLFESAGGSVVRTGKPELVFYQSCLEVIREILDGEQVDPTRVLAVGDSMAHDVIGANNAGIDVLFIQGGIHCKDLGIQVGESASLESITQLAEKYGARPTYTMPMLQW